MFIIIFLWSIIALAGCKHNKDIGDTAFTADNAIALRGICSIEIMIGHLGIATDSIVLYPNRKAGILFVGIFFALSGYGLMFSIMNKENYLDHFFVKKIGKILVPAYIVFLTGIVLHSIIEQNVSYFYHVLNMKDFFLATNWYVWELLMLYAVFYISIKVGKSLKIMSILILLFSITFVSIAYVFRLDNPWYGSTLCFVLGVFYFMYRDKFKEMFVLKCPIVKAAGCCFIVAMSITIFFVRGGLIGLLVARNIAAVFFVIIVLIFLYRFSLGNSISVWLGKYSYEIFLFHPVFINVLRPQIKNNVIYSFVVIEITILASYMYGICEANIKSIVQNGLLRPGSK